MSTTESDRQRETRLRRRIQEMGSHLEKDPHRMPGMYQIRWPDGCVHNWQLNLDAVEDFITCVAEGRTIRAAETASPGIVRRLLDDMVAQLIEPTWERLMAGLTSSLSQVTIQYI